MKSDTSILIIYTGGTIGMMRDPETGSLVPFNFKQISQQVPELKLFGFDLSTISFEKPLDSSDIDANTWIRLVEIINQNNSKYDGFVILHGSDTMSYTASALSFLLDRLNKPVILTGSQLPIGTLRTDGKENLITAIEIAAAKKNGKPIVPEVSIYFENNLYRGNRTTKHNAEHFNAFLSGNYPVLAKAGIHIKYTHSAILNPKSVEYSGIRVKKKLRLDTNVAILKVFPGINERFVTALFNTENLKGVVLETFGSGNALSTDWFINCLRKAIENGIIILNVTQCLAGSVVLGRYSTSVSMLEMGVLSGHDITTEAAITKLMFLFGQNLSKEEVISNLQCSIAGEMTVPDTQ